MQADAGALGWLAASTLSQFMRHSLWAYPIVEIVHIIGFVFVVGAVAMFDLRLLGLSRNLPVRASARHLLRWSVFGLVLAVPAGLLMFTAHPHDFVENGVFWLKLTLIALAGLNAAWFHNGVYRSVDDWNTGMQAPLAARLQAALSLLLWLGVISCGRLLAYT